MDMTPEQLHAHNMLTHTLWPEWVAYCAAGGEWPASAEWVESVRVTFGCLGRWVKSASITSDYEIAGEYYTWIP